MIGKFSLITLFLAVVSINSGAHAQMVREGTQLEKDLIRICKAIKSDRKLRIKQAIKKSGVQPKAIAKGLSCNGMDPISFAIHNDAKKSADYFAHFKAKTNKRLAKVDKKKQ